MLCSRCLVYLVAIVPTGVIGTTSLAPVSTNTNPLSTNTNPLSTNTASLPSTTNPLSTVTSGVSGQTSSGTASQSSTVSGVTTSIWYADSSVAHVQFGMENLDYNSLTPAQQSGMTNSFTDVIKNAVDPNMAAGSILGSTLGAGQALGPSVPMVGRRLFTGASSVFNMLMNVPGGSNIAGIATKLVGKEAVSNLLIQAAMGQLTPSTALGTLTGGRLGVTPAPSPMSALTGGLSHLIGRRLLPTTMPPLGALAVRNMGVWGQAPTTTIPITTTDDDSDFAWLWTLLIPCLLCCLCLLCLAALAAMMMKGGKKKKKKAPKVERDVSYTEEIITTEVPVAQAQGYQTQPLMSNPAV